MMPKCSIIGLLLLLAALLLLCGLGLCLYVSRTYHAMATLLIDERGLDLSDFYRLYNECYQESGIVPESLDDIAAHKCEHERGFLSAIQGRINIEWGTIPGDDNKDDKRHLLASPRDIYLTGGPILFS